MLINRSRHDRLKARLCVTADREIPTHALYILFWRTEAAMKAPKSLVLVSRHKWREEAGPRIIDDRRGSFDAHAKLRRRHKRRSALADKTHGRWLSDCVRDVE